MTQPIAAARYISLTTFRRDGTPVATPVWVAPLDDALVVITLADAWKVKRLRRDPRVEVRECDVRGRVAPDARTYSGTAEVLVDPADVDRVKAAMSRKYLLARVGNLGESLLGRWAGRKPRAGLRLTLDV